ncbi:MAG: BrnA antitoxin family protein [Parcubacteria group bacterium]|jgi:predicted DNA binding CopG/RHH family protein
MKEIKKFRPIPKFKSEKEERRFWETHDTVDYIDWDKAQGGVLFPNLRRSTRTISLRLTESMYQALKTEANKQDVPYQSCLKMILAEKLKKC